MKAIVFGIPEAAELVAKAKEETNTGFPQTAVEWDIAIVATRIWDMIIDTYADNMCTRGDGAIEYQSQWQKDMLEGIKRILRKAATG